MVPQGIPGWLVFATGLLIVTFRATGIHSPRAWIGWVESRFVAKRTLQLLGGLAALAAVVLAALAAIPEGAVGVLFVLSVALFVVVGGALVGAQNHMRMLAMATAEEEDKVIRISSIVFTAIGLLWALAPWFA